MESSPPALHVVGAAIFHCGRCLAVQRSATMSPPLSWEFPGGKVEPGESPEEALRREIKEELALEIAVSDFLGRGTLLQPEREIILDVYLAHITAGSLELREHACARWLDAANLESVEWAEADLPILPRVKALLAQRTA